MELEELDFSVTGRTVPRASPLGLRVVRSLGADDVPALAEAPKGPGPSRLEKIRETHHFAARLVAEGRPTGEVARATGYTVVRIGQLNADPMFQELVSYYKGQVEERYLNVHERLGAFGLAVVDELQSRLEERPETFTNRELKDTAEMILDRSVAPAKGGPKAQVAQGAGLTVNVSFAPVAPAATQCLPQGSATILPPQGRR